MENLPPHPPGESVGHIAITISVVFGIITAVVMGLRLFTRVCIIRAVGPDDILMTIAAFVSWAFIAATILSVKHGLGSHIDEVMARGIPNLITYAQIVWLSSIFYNACLGFIKTSVLALYMRLGDRILKKISLVMLVVVACSATANVLVCIFQCQPVKAAWDVTITKKRCVDINAFYLANAATNIATDLLTYTLPIPLVLKLQVPSKQKVALGVMLSLGLFACISSIIRITFIPRMLVNPDSTWAIAPAMYWSVIETNIGILAASIPSYKALAKRYLPVLLGEYSSKKAYPSGGASGGTARAFHKITDSTHMPSGSDEKEGKVEMYEMEDCEKSFAHATVVGQDNTSDEALHIPPGRIAARTQIETRYENGGGKGGSFFNAH